MKRSALAVFLMLAAFLPASASEKFSYFELSTEEGFPSRINSIFVNPNGYAMVGSEDGLMLIMNSRQKRIITSETASEGYQIIPGDIVYKVMKDLHGTKWILTDKGFIGYRTDGPSPMPLKGSASPNFALSLFCHGEDVYFGGDCSLWKFSYETGEVSTVMKIDSQDSMFPITDMLLVHGDILVLSSSSSSKIFTYNLKTGITGTAPDGWNYHIMSSYTDSRGDIWISDLNKGVRQIDPVSGKEIAFYAMDNSGISSDIINCICEYEEGKMLLGTSNGLNVLDLRTKNVDKYGYDFPDTGEIPLAAIMSIYCDQEGNIWCGRSTGGIVILFKPENEFFPVGTVNSIIEDSKDGSLWVAVLNKGLCHFHPSTAEIDWIESSEDISINSISYFSPDRLCLSTTEGELFCFDISSREITPFENLTRQSTLFTRGYGIRLCNDDIGRMVMFSNNAFRYDSATGKLDVFPWYRNTFDNHLHPVDGSHGKYSYDNYSFYKWSEREETKLEKIYTIETTGFIWSASLSDDNVMWYVSGSTLYKYKMDREEAEAVTSDFDSRPQMVLCDDRGLVWIGTAKSLYFYDSVKGNMGILQDIDGIPNGEYFPHSKLKASDGTLYFGLSNGLAAVHPGLMLEEEGNPRAAILNCSVDGKLCRDMRRIRVSHNHTSINFGFFVIASDILRNRKYKVTVDGGSDRYYQNITSTPDVSLSRIKPGHYVISLSWTSKNGNWNKPVKVARFDVVDVWYRQWWAYIFEVFLLFGGFRVFYEIKKRQRDQMNKAIANDERYNFIINISHEFRTPLTMILAPIKKMLDHPDNLNPDVERQLKRMHTQAERMNFLLDTIVTSDKMKSGKSSINLEEVNFNQWVTERGAEFVAEAKANNMEIVFKLDENIKNVKLDDNVCRVAFYNLIANAIKHNVPGTPITVRTELILGRGMVRLNVRDHGTVLGDFDVTSIFDNYYKDTEDKTGFGVGLIFSKNMVDRIGGTLGAYNNIGDDGATFWLDLPLTRDDEYFAL